ncbi:MAG: 30S ribosomal protein S17 [Candidatus Aenigmarchaeota archaeon]|nr:30S ribosomal protein S17 [Candidatus Aenigmarchaeota archaeon]
MKVRNIGIDANPPKKECSDAKCVWHGKTPIRGGVLKGKIVSAKAHKTAVVKREFLHFLPKYERYERRHSKITAYNPACIDAKEGDTVTIAECRPLSKTKSFIIIEKVNA